MKRSIELDSWFQTDGNRVVEKVPLDKKMEYHAYVKGQEHGICSWEELYPMIKAGQVTIHHMFDVLDQAKWWLKKQGVTTFSDKVEQMTDEDLPIQLFSGFHECDEGCDKFDFSVKARSLADVMEWLRQGGKGGSSNPDRESDWFKGLVEATAGWNSAYSGFTEEAIRNLPAWDLVEAMNDTQINGDSCCAYRIFGVILDEVPDLTVSTPIAKRKI